MNWLDIILDHISEYGSKNITKLERQYLENYGKENQTELEEQLDKKFDFYRSMYFYELDDAYWFNPDVLSPVSDDTIKETRLNMLWDNLEMGDSESFTKIYEVPHLFLDLNWNNLPVKYQIHFEEYWKSYYNFNI